MDNYIALLLIIIIGIGIYYYCEVMTKKITEPVVNIAPIINTKKNDNINNDDNFNNVNNKKKKEVTFDDNITDLHYIGAVKYTGSSLE